jgi:hypothetical protein
VANPPFRQFNGDGCEELNDLESQREQELAEARAIQVGMLPQGPLRTGDATICYEFPFFCEVGGDFLDFFMLTDGDRDLSGRRYRKGTSDGTVRSAGSGHTVRRA